YGEGEAIREGAYAGSFTIGQDGAVSYLAAAVPEPGAVSLLGLVSASLLFRRRRSA
ncbi:MAG: PEP-CTERM sorting domain-containing protein, partial [Verrucomicrobiaceae bacterium]